jgi:phosphoketolase
MRGVYQSHGQFWTLVVPKAATIADFFTLEEAGQLLEQGVLRLDWASHQPESQQVVLTAVGAYQLEEVLKASARLTQRDIPHSGCICWNQRASGNPTARVSESTLYPNN